MLLTKVEIIRYAVFNHSFHSVCWYTFGGINRYVWLIDVHLKPDYFDQYVGANIMDGVHALMNCKL
jgi:hypothetical protein